MSRASQPDYILDASALVALMLGEPREAQVRDLLDRSYIHSINFAETAAALERAGIPRDEVAASLGQLRLRVDEEFSRQQALACAALASRFGGSSLSLGDRVCLSVAESRGSFAVTADRRWSERTGIASPVQLIR